MPRTERDRMLAGELYLAADPELVAERRAAADWMARYNALGLTNEQRVDLLREQFAAVGEGVEIRAPFHCDYGGNIEIGDRVFLNFNCVILDVVKVTIGDGTQIGPGVQILTADHPRDAAERASGLEFGKSIIIGRDVWIGGGALILPGVHVGDGAIIGAGSVVTRDVPRGATVVGNPARQVVPKPVSLHGEAGARG
ncbi:sugar O-acetyltransferase [Xanthobacteraceae bacterium A53D]